MKAPNKTKLRELQKLNKDKHDTCSKCGRNSLMTIDHIIPKNLLEQLGLEDEILNDEENMEVICITCNRFKGGRVDMAHPKTLYLLQKYIKKLSTDTTSKPLSS